MNDNRAFHNSSSSIISRDKEIYEKKHEPYAEHDPDIEHKIAQEGVVPAHPELAWSKIRRTMRDSFSEFFGVFIMILFGDG
jgi:hypothetical protein